MNPILLLMGPPSASATPACGTLTTIFLSRPGRKPLRRKTFPVQCRCKFHSTCTSTKPVEFQLVTICKIKRVSGECSSFPIMRKYEHRDPLLPFATRSSTDSSARLSEGSSLLTHVSKASGPYMSGKGIMSI